MQFTIFVYFYLFIYFLSILARSKSCKGARFRQRFNASRTNALLIVSRDLVDYFLNHNTAARIIGLHKSRRFLAWL